MGKKRLVLRHTRGFTILEIIVVLVCITVAALMMGNLGQQLAKFAANFRQTGSVADIRNRVAAITKSNPDWLAKLKGLTFPNGTDNLYSACMPDPTTPAGVGATFTGCTNDTDNELKTSDPQLGSIAGALHVNAAPVVDLMGEPIAGTVGTGAFPDGPLFLDSDGRPCTGASARIDCPLESTGYLMREIAGGNPGNVKIVVKIQKNSEYTKGNTAPMKPIFMSVDVGKQWQDPVGVNSCPSPQIKIGYRPSGDPACINPTAGNCPAGTVNLGLNPDSSLRCEALPTTCALNEFVIMNAANQLACSGLSPCGAGQVFLGYFAGTGTPMCSAPNVNCGDNEILTGIQVTGSGSNPVCLALPDPACTSAQTLAYTQTSTGHAMTCVTPALTAACTGLNEFMVGINADGTARCVTRAPASETLDLPTICQSFGGTYNATATPKCALASGGPGTPGAPGTPGEPGTPGTSPAMAKAWVVFSVTTSAPYAQIINSFNVSSVTSPSVGDFVINTIDPISFVNGTPMLALQKGGEVGTDSVAGGILSINGNGHSDHRVTVVYYGTNAGSRARIKGTLYVLIY